MRYWVIRLDGCIPVVVAKYDTVEDAKQNAMYNSTEPYVISVIFHGRAADLPFPCYVVESDGACSYLNNANFFNVPTVPNVVDTDI